ncbi:hypothetical protein [uncultured Aquimarina sp.]|uniref:hypothetical protein n=1 Tax=uncultured Aquimarina sp. TaxID=575652 RepID=UPI00260F5CCE|nr:hypothetical protein [uncultured Aquimarina sp.]
MKLQNKLFGKLTKVMLVLSVMFISSCGSDDDGTVPAEPFVALPSEVLTTFSGELTYTPASGMGIVAGVQGTATISVSGTNHTISFSDGVPSITGIRFLGSSNGNYASVGTSGSVAGIVIEGNELTIGATMDSNVWAFVPN